MVFAQHTVLLLRQHKQHRPTRHADSSTVHVKVFSRKTQVLKQPLFTLGAVQIRTRWLLLDLHQVKGLMASRWLICTFTFIVSAFCGMFSLLSLHSIVFLYYNSPVHKVQQSVTRRRMSTKDWNYPCCVFLSCSTCVVTLFVFFHVSGDSGVKCWPVYICQI